MPFSRQQGNEYEQATRNLGLLGGLWQEDASRF
jgi:hypothetical protein